jgi:Sel1 repeat-containing protein
MAGRRRKQSIPNRFAPLRLTSVLTLVVAALSLLPRVSGNLRLAGSFWAAAGVLLALQLVLRRQVGRTGRALHYEFVPVRVHYVQAAMQGCIYAYWGWYWREVYDHIPLIAAQLAFVYALDMLVSWLRRDPWVLGFGPFPIVFSTNLFMWFRDDWFFLQFLLVATGVLGKEFVKWRREGRLTHIFNPSAFSLFFFSVALIVTKSTPITWAQEIATTQILPPNIYLEIFLVGLVVQGLFSVTLVTLSAAAALYVLNVAYTASTGTYYFIDTNIPVPVFLGLHLLVTDPATSPRTALGKIVFGGMYGAGVFGLYEMLGWIGAPTFYDKLLIVPPLNLTVRALDRGARALAARLHPIVWPWRWTPRQLNLAHMAVWALLFATMLGTGFLNRNHPGQDPVFWQRACDDGRRHGCRTWSRVLAVKCRDGSAEACVIRGRVLDEGRVAARDAVEAGRNFDRACDLGLSEGCDRLRVLVGTDGPDSFVRACDAGDGPSCLIVGSLEDDGVGVGKARARAVALFDRSCAMGWAPGCNRLGKSYLSGEGTAVDLSKAVDSFDRACRGRNAAGCFNVAVMYGRGLGTLRDDAVARQRFQQACDLGLQLACQWGGRSATFLDR